MNVKTKPQSAAPEGDNSALIFIDTNKYLDFYRVPESSGRIELLDLIEQHKDIIITTEQVEMEYFKNRQGVIKKTLDLQTKPQWSGLTPPAFLIGSEPAEAIQAAKDAISAAQNEIRKRIEHLIVDPASDRVYQTLSKFFKHQSPYILRRVKTEESVKQVNSVREIALKRFTLGYPPRKPNDTSIGDAINWEWILRCVYDSGRDVIIVSDDGDYGVHREEGSYLNDFLRRQFEQMLVDKYPENPPTITFTNRLADAFKRVAIAVSEEAEKEEKERIATAPTPQNPPPGFVFIGDTLYPLEELRARGFAVATAVSSADTPLPLKTSGSP